MAKESFVTVESLQKALGSSRVRRGYRVSILSSHTLAIGSGTEPRKLIFDFESEQLSAGETTPQRRRWADLQELTAQRKPESKSKRVSGTWTFTHGSFEICKTSLPDLLEAVLLHLESVHPGTLHELSRIKPRTRRIVARRADDLFDQKHLADKSRRIADGWWMGTNNSANETRNWIRRACEIAGIDPIVDVKIGI